MAQQRRTYLEYLADLCRKRLDQEEQFLPFPSPTADATVREAQRGKPCSLCGKAIPMEPDVDPHPREYVWPSGRVMRLHGLSYSGAPDKLTSCLFVWEDVSRAWGRPAPTAPR